MNHDQFVPDLPVESTHYIMYMPLICLALSSHVCTVTLFISVFITPNVYRCSELKPTPFHNLVFSSEAASLN